MIVPMKKYTFLVYHADYQKFLEELRQVGVVDVVERTKDLDDETRDQLLEQKQIADTIKILQRRKFAPVKASHENRDGTTLVKLINELLNEREALQQQLAALSKEISNLEPWGDFRIDTLKKLRGAGLVVSFYIASTKKFDPEWEKLYNIGVVNTIGPNVYFIHVSQRYEQVEFEAEEIKTPERSLSGLRQRRQELKARIKEIDETLDEFAATSLPLLHETLINLTSKTDFKKVLANTQLEVEDKVMMLQGFVPETCENKLVRFCEERGVLYVSAFPKDDEKVPILLKNNRFSRLYEIIGNFYELPNHRELDLVPFFAPFYMMFFGFCLGDAGYGLFIVLMAGLAKRKLPDLKPVLTLAQFLGLATVVFGILTGTFFGINLIEAEISWLSGIKSFMIDYNQMFYLAILLGVVQILFGMVLKVVNITRTQGFWHSLSTIGWLLLIIGLGSIFALKKAGIVSVGFSTVMQYITLSASAALILLFNHPKRKIYVNFGAGLWDVYVMATGLLGDLLSYLRLFALGISSAILGMVFNSMAMNMKPDIIILGPLVMIIILVFGHGITIFMSALGAFVHPIRLTFVEFYKNAGFTGGGKAFKPFAEPASKT